MFLKNFKNIYDTEIIQWRKEILKFNNEHYNEFINRLHEYTSTYYLEITVEKNVL